MPDPRNLDVAPGASQPQATAERVRAHMIVDDHATRALGIDVVSIGPGTAHARMAVRQDMLNGFAICHGGLITTLADTAFAYACNAYGEVTVASGLGIDFIAPAHLGDVLDAQCTEQTMNGRTGVYDVIVNNQRGERIALFRGRSHRLKGKQVVAPAAAPR